AGIDRAVWELSRELIAPGSGTVTPLPLVGPTGPPYDGVTEFQLTAAADPAVMGTYALQMTPTPANPNRDVDVVSAGWVPNLNAFVATRTVRVTLTSFASRFSPPGPLSVNGELLVSGSATIGEIGQGNVCNSNPPKPAVGTYSSGNTDVSGNGKICSDAGCSPKGTCDGVSCLESQPDAATVFDDLQLTQDELMMLRDLAKANGTYYTGSQTFTDLPSGVVFVDTASGQPPSLSNLGDLANVSVTGGNSAGWLVAMGTVHFNGNLTHNGLVYAADDIIAGNGTATVSGAVISMNFNDSNATQIDTAANGNVTINYDCNALNQPPGLPKGFFVKPGTWDEVLS
ncbi:MAG: hypothetical protein ACREJV_13680, partial [Candidatus Rokuibacteriota bacterium]